MKILRFFLASIALLLLMAGCSSGVLPSDPVGLPAAFAHCVESTSYWVWGIIVSLFSFAGIWWNIKASKAGKVGGSNIIFFICAAAILFVWFYRPSEIAWNTTVEQATRGVWIGY